MSITIRRLGQVDYAQTYDDMVRRVGAKEVDNANTQDEFWCLQHPPVYTLGKAGKRLHILNAGDIPVIETDRGGQVTYHGPGQLVVYVLINLRRHELGPKGLINRLETAMINSLSQYRIKAGRRKGAPGVYVDDKKIGALGLRIKNGMSYHGLAVNVDLDLTPFKNINPCGYAGLEVTRIADYYPGVSMDRYTEQLLEELSTQFPANGEQRLAS